MYYVFLNVNNSKFSTALDSKVTCQKTRISTESNETRDKGKEAEQTCGFFRNNPVLQTWFLNQLLPEECVSSSWHPGKSIPLSAELVV